MVSYKFKTRTGLTEITANREFQEACFDSIRSGNPLMVPIEEQNREITCLEYILDAASSVEPHDYTDIELFENLAHSSIDLNQNLCHIPYEDDTPSTCIPKIIDSYVAISGSDYRVVKTVGRKLVFIDNVEAREGVSRAMKTILTKYPHLIQDTTCRPHFDKSRYGDDRDNITCFEKLLREGYDVDFIDVNQMPDGFFDIPMCHETGGHGIATCYKMIIDDTLSVEPIIYQYRFNNAKQLLYDMIQSKKLEWQLYTKPGACGDEFSCLEKMLYPTQTKRGSALVKTLLNAYTDKIGVIDTESESSPFSGEKCRTGSFGSKYENCLNTAIRTVSKLFDAYDSDVRSDAEKLGNRIASQPQFSDDCGSLKFLSLVATVDTLRSRGYSDHMDFITKIAKKSMSTYHLEPLRELKCMSDVGNPHQVNGVDYALELGFPVNYQILQNRISTPELLMSLTMEPCVSIRTGENIPCLQKLTKELLVNYDEPEPEINKQSRAIIETILNAGGSEVFPYVYPEGGAYFTDYLTESIFHAITVSANTSANAIELLELMIRAMGNRFGETGNPFVSNTYPRLGRILDIIEEAPRRYPKVDYNQKFSKPSEVRYILNSSFTRTKEDAKKALESGLFEYGLQKSTVEVLSQWFDEYKDSPEILDLIVQAVMGKTKKKTLIEFFKSYNRAQQGKTKKERDIVITPQVQQLFEYIYKKPMDEYFKPSLETRMLYDELCFSNPKSDDHDFLQEIYDDVKGNSELRSDGKGIVGVYDVSVGDTGLWGSDHIIRYADVIGKILYGSTQLIGEPYIIRKENMHSVPTGLIEAVNNVSDIEYIGKRIDNIKGKLEIRVSPRFTPAFVFTSPDEVVRDFRANDNDFTVYLYYVDKDGVIIEHTETHFKMLDALQKLPKKLKKKLQAKYPRLFGQLDAVLAKEASDIATIKKPSIDTYKLVISNKPTDIIRASGCQQWDKASCMALYGGSHNMSLRDYLDSGSYIAYLTKKSEYEPQWLARLFMHKCTNCNCVSIQDRLRYYEIEREESRHYPNWHILYDAVKTALADKGINDISHDRDCIFAWGRDIREEIEERGNERCNDEMGERMSECVHNCEDNCESDDKIDEYIRNVSDQVQKEINTRVTDALKEYIDEDGEYTISEREREKITGDVEEEVHADFEGDLIREEIQDCKDGCDNECEDVNDEFDCFQFLANAGLLDDEDSEVWTDNTQIQSLRKDSPSYKSILLERTGQTDSSLAFVKQSKTEF